MRFVLKTEDNNDSNAWFKETLGAMYNKLSDEDKSRINNWLNGDTNKIVDPKKIKGFINNVVSIKDYLAVHSSNYSVDINQKKGILTILFSEISFNDIKAIKSIIGDARHLTIGAKEILGTGVVEVVIEYDITSEVR